MDRQHIQGKDTHIPIRDCVNLLPVSLAEFTELLIHRKACKSIEYINVSPRDAVGNVVVTIDSLKLWLTCAWYLNDVFSSVHTAAKVNVPSSYPERLNNVLLVLSNTMTNSVDDGSIAGTGIRPRLFQQGGSNSTLVHICTGSNFPTQEHDTFANHAKQLVEPYSPLDEL